MKKVFFIYISCCVFSSFAMNGVTIQQSFTQHLKLSEAIRVVEKSEVSPVVTSQATSTWNKFKDSVLQDEKVFDDFLDVVYRGQYQQYDCSYGNLLIYRTLLATSFIESAKSMYESVNDERKSSLAQKAFLVYFAARSTFPCLLDSSNEGVLLENDIREMLNDAFERHSSEYQEQAKVFQAKLDKQKSVVNYKIAAQISAAYSYVKQHNKQLANILWRYFFEHQMVKNWTPH